MTTQSIPRSNKTTLEQTNVSLRATIVFNSTISDPRTEIVEEPFLTVTVLCNGRAVIHQVSAVFSDR
jgi:hypothetical protein